MDDVQTKTGPEECSTSSDRAASMEAAAVLRPHPKAAAGRMNYASMLIAGALGYQTLLH